MQELIKIFASRFINHKTAYYQQWTDGVKYGYKAIWQAPTTEIIESHLRGDITIAAPALDESNNGRWICFDSDTNNGALNILDSYLHQLNWHTIPEGQRSGRDGHLWLPFDSPISGENLVILANTMVKLAGVAGAGLEIFPKQAKADKLPNCVRLPLGIHLKPGADWCRGWFDIPERDIQSQLIWLAQQPLNDANIAIELVERHRPVLVPPVRQMKKYRNSNHERINILNLVQARHNGREFIGQCPVCANEGHDRHQDNLHISLDGQKFCCWYGGQPGKIHKAGDIVKELLACRSGVA